MINSLLLSFALTFQPAQDSIPLINSNEILEQVDSLYDAEEYNELINQLLMVSPFDSNYISVQTELITAYKANDQINEALTLCEGILSSRNDLNDDFFVRYGNVYYSEGETTDAIRIWQKGLDFFPYNPTLRYNIAYAKSVLGKYEEAVADVQELLKINPYYSSAHQLLANIMSKTNQRTKASLSLLTYIAINPSENWALVRLNSLMSDAYRSEGSLNLEIDNEVFEYYDNLLRSKAALDDRYESSVDFEVAVAQQTELLINKLRYEEGTDDFWMNFYVPYLRQIADKGLTQAFVYFILYSTKNDDILNWINKHQEEKDAWIAVANNKLTANRRLNTRTLDGETGTFMHWYYTNNKMQAIGNEKGEFNVGPYEFYHPNGRLKANGRYNDQGQKTGTWLYYHDNGQLSSAEPHNSDGELEGEVKSFAANGDLLSIGLYKGGQLVDNWEWYHPCGSLKEQYPYKDGKGNGTGNGYFETGELKYTYQMSEDDLNGSYLVYYKNGKLKEELSFKDDQRDGEYKSFHPNDSLSEIGNYVEGQRNDAWKGYFSNGRLSYEGQYASDEPVGEWLLYYPNGSLKRKENYNDNGQQNGTIEWFDEDGMLHSLREYENGTLIGYKYFDKENTLLFEIRDPEGNMNYSSYYPTGQKYSEGKLTNGLLNGSYTTYHLNGNVYQKGEMLEDYWHGSYTEYDENGNVKMKGTYEEGTLNGYYQTFFDNGKMEKQSWLDDGNIEQTWREYYPDGGISDEYYYTNQQANGVAKHFTPTGELYSEEIYKDDRLQAIIQYDSSGNAYHKADLIASDGEMILKRPSGSVFKSAIKKCEEFMERETYSYDNGQTMSNYDFLNSQYSAYQHYERDGTLTVKGNYLNGESHGDWYYYHESGKLRTIANYHLGKREGETKFYYENGQLESVCQYYQDEKDGACKYYDPQGMLQLIKYYKKDFGPYAYQYEVSEGVLSDSIFLDPTRNETIKAFFANGKPSAVQNYVKHYFDGENIFYSSNGTALRSSQFKYGDNHGKSTDRYENGAIKSISDYYLGQRHGDFKSYHANGKLKEESTWYYGKRHGWTREYNENGVLVSEIYYWNDLEY